MSEAHQFDWIKVADYNEMSAIAANLFTQQLIRKPDSVLGLATGASPIGFYEKLVAQCTQGGISFTDVRTFNLDEYIGIEKTHPLSFHSYMEQHFFKKVDLPASHKYVPDGMAADLEKECLRYEKLIRESGGVDVQLLGIGVNGHIGFNEPGTAFHSRTHIVELSDSTRAVNAKYFPSEETVPRKAITIGIQTILEAKQIILLAFGEQKKEAIERLRSGIVSEDFPASSLHQHPRVTVLYGT